MLHGKKGFERLVWAAKNVLNQSLCWLVVNVQSIQSTTLVAPGKIACHSLGTCIYLSDEAFAPLPKHHPIHVNAGPQSGTQHEVLVPNMTVPFASGTGQLEQNDIQSWTYETLEWLGLSGIGSRRILETDNIDPYLSRYALPDGALGKHSRAVSDFDWLAINVCSHRTSATGQRDGYSIILNPPESVPPRPSLDTGEDVEENHEARSNEAEVPASTMTVADARKKEVKRVPVILALNGLAHGGGTEILINADLAYASRTAVIALPEVKRGVTAIAGALPRLIRTVGRPRAMEMALTGRNLDAEEAAAWGLINGVVEADADADKLEEVEEVVKRAVVRKAVDVAQSICENSPDSVIVTREGVKMGWEGVGADEATRLVAEAWGPRLMMGENTREGVRAFVEKRMPRWRDSKL
ncbi:MAG: hypothetical protein Q9160_000898 [Pyrenula sp. 1 TL-2023]